MNNPNRGEHLVELAGKQYKTKLNLDSIVRIETATSSSIVRVAQRLAQGDLMTKEIAAILLIAIRGGGNDIDEKTIEKIVWEAGLVEAMTVCGTLLTNALSGGSGKPEEASE